MSKISDEVWSRAKSFPRPPLHEAAGRIGALPSQIKPIAPDQKVCGPAFPVKSPPGDNLWLHRAIASAEPGEVLVIDVGDGTEFGYWGEVMAVAAQARKIAGLVISGGVRDARQMAALGFPVFSAAVCIRGTGKDPYGQGALQDPVTIGDVTINPGDLVLGDSDGVVVIPTAKAAAAVEESETRDRKEIEIFQQLRGGETTIAIYDLPGGETWRE